MSCSNYDYAINGHSTRNPTEIRCGYILLPSHPAKWFFRHLTEYEIRIWHTQNGIPRQLSKISLSEQSQVVCILNEEEIMFE